MQRIREQTHHIHTDDPLLVWVYPTPPLSLDIYPDRSHRHTQVLEPPLPCTLLPHCSPPFLPPFLLLYCLISFSCFPLIDLLSLEHLEAFSLLFFLSFSLFSSSHQFHCSSLFFFLSLFLVCGSVFPT